MPEPEPPTRDAARPPTGSSGEADSLHQRLAALKSELGAANARESSGSRGRPGAGSDASALGAGMRAASEMVAGILVGTALGYGLDQFLGTRPWFLIIFMMLGMMAGFRNIYRLGMRPTQPPGSENGGGPDRAA